jgi:hypothetical protein
MYVVIAEENLMVFLRRKLAAPLSNSSQLYFFQLVDM